MKKRFEACLLLKYTAPWVSMSRGRAGMRLAWWTGWARRWDMPRSSLVKSWEWSQKLIVLTISDKELELRVLICLVKSAMHRQEGTLVSDIIRMTMYRYIQLPQQPKMLYEMGHDFFYKQSKELLLNNVIINELYEACCRRQCEALLVNFTGIYICKTSASNPKCLMIASLEIALIEIKYQISCSQSMKKRCCLGKVSCSWDEPQRKNAVQASWDQTLSFACNLTSYCKELHSNRLVKSTTIQNLVRWSTWFFRWCRKNFCKLSLKEDYICNKILF